MTTKTTNHNIDREIADVALWDLGHINAVTIITEKSFTFNDRGSDTVLDKQINTNRINRQPLASVPLGLKSSRPFLTCCHDLFLRVVLVLTTFSHMLPRPFLAGCFGRHDFFLRVVLVVTTFSHMLPRPFLAGCFGRHDFFLRVVLVG